MSDSIAGREMRPCNTVALFDRIGIVALGSLLLGGFVTTGQAVAADAPPLKSFEIVRIPETDAPRIDGKLDDAAWQRAVLIEDLHQISPRENEDPTDRTQFYVMYDKDAIYVGARVFYQKPEDFTANILRQGEEVNNEDRISVILDTFNDKRNGYRFEVNANSIREDALFLDTTQIQRDWDGIYQAQAVRDGSGWTAEMAIPFKTLSFDPATTTWGVNFQRATSRNSERDGWVSRNRFQNPSSSGEMTGLANLDQGLGLDVIPGMSFRNVKDFVAGTSDFKMEPSLDAYFKVTSALNAAVTFNTDFSATEIDERQVNLSRFNLFFPEKRSFFLRDSDIFEFGRLKGGIVNGIINPTFSRSMLENGRPFFSRSIGLSSNGQPVDIIAGTKLSGRIGDFDMGALAIRQDETATVDAQTLLVGRVAANVLEESSLGLTVTSGNPRSNLDNTLVGADFRYLNSHFAGNHDLEGELWYQQSKTEGISGDDAAYGIRLRSPNNTGWRGGLGLKELQANFNPALGYVNRRDIRNYTGELGYGLRPRTGLLQLAYSGVDFERFDRIEGGLQSKLATFRVADLTSRRGDNLRFRYYQSSEVLRAPFEISEGVLLPIGDYDFNEYSVQLDTAASRKLSLDLVYRQGDFYSGERWQGTGELIWKPSPHFWFTGKYEYNDVTLPEGDFIARLTSTKFAIMFNATWSWVTLAQYDNVSDSVAVQSMLHWIPQAGREMFVVYGHNLLDELGDGTFRSQRADAVLKFNYTFRY